MRVSNPYIEDEVVEAVLEDDWVAEHAKFISESYIKWARRRHGSSVPAPSEWEKMIWMK